MTEIFNKFAEKEKRRLLRANSTEAEKIIWEKIRNKQINKKKFRRQVSIGSYIADFYCPELRLVIEIDGNVHNSNYAKEYDAYRDIYMESLDLKIFRFSNEDIFNKLDEVIDKIKILTRNP